MAKIIRIFGVSLAVITLLVFATIVVTGWHHHDSVNDAQCPYCHLGHQTAEQAEVSQDITPRLSVSGWSLPEALVVAISPVFSLTASRAPPTA
jgi:hypothetical protein